MTMQAVQEFYKAGSKNQELLAKLIKNTKGPEDFIRNAVAEGKQQGFDFSYEAADQFIKNMQGAVARQDAARFTRRRGRKGAPEVSAIRSRSARRVCA